MRLILFRSSMVLRAMDGLQVLDFGSLEPFGHFNGYVARRLWRLMKGERVWPSGG